MASNPPKIAPLMSNGIARPISRQSSSISRFLLSSPLAIHSFLSTWAFTGVWISIVGSHLFLGLVRFMVAAAHIFLANPAAYASVTMVQIPRGVLMATGWTMGTVAVMHFVSLFLISVRSIRAGRLTFSAAKKTNLTAIQPSGPSVHSVNRLQPHQGLLHRVKTMYATLQLQIGQLFGVDGVVGINGPLFFLFFDGLKLLEMFTQTYQAYQLSCFVSSESLNVIMVVVIFFNGVVTPCVVYAVRNVKKRTTQRLAVVVVDLLLDLVYAEAIPGLVLLPILYDYDWKISAFPPRLSFDDVWGSNAVATTRYVLVTSYLDLAATIVPHLNFLLSMHTFKKLLHHRADIESVLTQAGHDASSMSSATRNSNKLNPKREQLLKAQSWSHLLNVGMFAWGVIVLGLHIDARQQQPAGSPAVPVCKLPLSPWRLGHSSRPSCAVLYVNCYRLNIRGSAEEIHEVIKELQPDAVTTLVLAHCPALTIPPTVTRYSRMFSLEIFNSTLVEWNSSAKLTQSRHALMHHVFLIETNVTQVPDALLHDDLPPSFQYLTFHVSNLSHLPESIGEVWGPSSGRPHHWRILNFINTPLRDLPKSVSSISADVLQLRGSHIPHLPDGIAERVQHLYISGVDFLTLPPSVEGQPALQSFSLEDTSVDQLPAWTIAWLDNVLAFSRDSSFFASLSAPPPPRASLRGSPLCERAEYAKYAQFCQSNDEFDLNVFPSDVIKAQWQL